MGTTTLVGYADFETNSQTGVYSALAGTTGGWGNWMDQQLQQYQQAYSAAGWEPPKPEKPKKQYFIDELRREIDEWLKVA